MSDSGEVDPRREAARILRQRLEMHRGFGWRVPLRPLPPSRSAQTVRPSPPARPSPPPAGRTAAAGEPDPAAELARRAALLSPLCEEVRACTRCALSHERTQAVFGVGNPCARLMFVGEGPGFEEDRQGEPFVGPAGQLLTAMVEAMGLRRDDVYIANVVKCRPPNNRTPDAFEVARCLPYLRRQIEIVRPEVICALGAVAAHGLLGVESSVARLRGSFHDCGGIPVRVTYHPAYLLRSPHEKRKAWDDIQAVMARLGLEPPRRRRESP
jgi:DNA polymerase